MLIPYYRIPLDKGVEFDVKRIVRRTGAAWGSGCAGREEPYGEASP